MKDKITTAIYFVTGHVNDNEPLKWRLRSLALELLETSEAQSTVSTIDTIVGVLSVARMGGVLSDMNAELIQQACRNERSRHNPGVALPEDFFGELQQIESTETDKNDQEQLLTTQTTKPSTKPDVVNKGHVPKGTSTDKRRDAIVSFLDTNSPATTTDIKKVVRSVSEKTIQRDLKWLIKKGVVSREGTRRWATYSLAK